MLVWYCIVHIKFGEYIRKRPQLFSDMIRQIKSMPGHAILRIARDLRDSD